MPSVTNRIKEVKQPRGGYLPPKDFAVRQIADGNIVDLSNENIHSVLVGLAVDYLTRLILYRNPLQAFKISIMGAALIGEENQALKKATSIKELNSKAIIAACQLAGYDVCFRAGPMWYKPVNGIVPNDLTVKNIKVMVNRSLAFFKEYGPVVKDGFTFEGGYTKTVNTGDGDFITANTLWDFKVSKDEPKSAHTLQLLMYYIMGQHSVNKDLHGITQLGIFNPRLNKIYIKPISEIPSEIIKQIEDDVICY